MFIGCLYSLSNHSKNVADYYSFIGNANTMTNPNFSSAIKRVINDFHAYFYNGKHIGNMNTGDFQEMSNKYGTEEHCIPMEDVLNALSNTEKDTIRTISLFVFNSYQSDKKEFDLFTYDNRGGDILPTRG